MLHRLPIVVLSLLIAPPTLNLAAQRTFLLDPAASQVTFTLDTTFHEVHGSMALTGGTMSFDPQTGEASGAITVDARRAETGNARRDRTMHAEVLESARFPSIVFTVRRIEGKLVDQGSSELRLSGVMTLHGADHPMTLTAAIQSAGGRVSGAISFVVPYVEWGLHDPSIFVARAAKTVEVTIHAAGRWSDAAGAVSR